MRGVLAVGVSIAELFDSGAGIVALFLVTVLVIVSVLLIVLSNDTLYDRVEKLMRIAHGQDDATADRQHEPADVDDDDDEAKSWRRWLPFDLVARWKRRRPADRPRARR